MKKITKKIIKIIKETNDKKYSNLDIGYYLTNETVKFENLDDVRNFLETLDENGDITNTEIIYYGNAIDYLKENDPSLQESLEIAAQFGYTEIEDVNSELLASLHATANKKAIYYEFINDVVKQIKKEGIFI